LNVLTLLPIFKKVRDSKRRRVSTGEMRDIQIWSIKSGLCLLTHAKGVFDIVCLLNEHLVSCSLDKNIKVWTLDRGECLQILKGHSSVVKYLVLLNNG